MEWTCNDRNSTQELRIVVPLHSLDVPIPEDAWFELYMNYVIGVVPARFNPERGESFVAFSVQWRKHETLEQLKVFTAHVLGETFAVWLPRRSFYFTTDTGKRLCRLCKVSKHFKTKDSVILTRHTEKIQALLRSLPNARDKKEEEET